MQADGPLYRRWWKVCLFPRCCLPCNAVLHPCRASVSQNKTRYRQDGFDLDLTYVTSRIIVHGFPSTGVEHIYRNPRTEVQRLLEKYHRGHYKVYNFANEPGRTYPDQLFQGRVERYPFSDHTCPPLESVVNFCENAKAWLDMDENNVVSLHCKAGKGRAGIMAACLLVRLGETAAGAVSKFDATRVSDLKGLTVVNQRKWPFMYERLVKEVWGVRDSIGMVPGQDPDLRAPALRAACLREVSLQFQPPAAGSRKSGVFLPNLSCAIYQQQPMGKTLVHRTKMVQVAPQEGELGTVYAAALPRSAVVQGTFQVLISGAVGVSRTQKNVIDFWSNTTFLTPEGGGHTFGLSEMDVSPPKLAERLHQAAAKLVVLHVHPHAESPRRRLPVKSRAAPPPSVPVPAVQQRVPTTAAAEAAAPAAANGEGAREEATGAQQAARRCEDGEELRSSVSGRSPPPQAAAPEKNGGAGVASSVGEGGSGSGNETGLSSTGGGDSAGGVPMHSANPEEAAAGETADGGGTAVAVERHDGGSSNNAPEVSASEPNNQNSPAEPSPDLPGPSPAGMVSPVWTFEGRTPSNKVETSGRAIGDSRWTQRKMWMSNQGTSSGGASTPTRNVSLNAVAPEVKPREERRALQRRHSGSRSMDSLGNSVGSTAAPTGTSSSMRGDRAAAVPKGFPVHRGETDSESDDQLAVRASAFGGGAGLGPNGPGMGPVSIQGEQWAMEMEMVFAQERRRWEEHQRCLETELDWALAARARAEARSEEDSARVEVLEGRVSAWRDEYSVIGRDVKQAVRLLEMSLSGLMSAETALNIWRDEIPSKAYDEILGCLTKGDMALSSTASSSEKE
ncbi:unnamed protein product [Ectocarpus fasciculatus]